MQLPIVDDAVRYDLPYGVKSYILIVRKDLNVSPMNNNPLPPFVLIESGVTVQFTPKINVRDPTVAYHSIFFPDASFQISLSL